MTRYPPRVCFVRYAISARPRDAKDAAIRQRLAAQIWRRLWFGDDPATSCGEPAPEVTLAGLEQVVDSWRAKLTPAQRETLDVLDAQQQARMRVFLGAPERFTVELPETWGAL